MAHSSREGDVDKVYQFQGPLNIGEISVLSTIFFLFSSARAKVPIENMKKLE
jgi:hypothetical protein